jgi:hypothetical protein
VGSHGKPLFGPGTVHEQAAGVLRALTGQSPQSIANARRDGADVDAGAYLQQPSRELSA